MPIWPDVFLNGKTKYNNKNEALADAYSGWGLCHAGNRPPEEFGNGMVFIGEYIGVSPSVENLDKLYEELNLT